jgi:hypothetical protein
MPVCYFFHHSLFGRVDDTTELRRTSNLSGAILGYGPLLESPSITGTTVRTSTIEPAAKVTRPTPIASWKILMDPNTLSLFPAPAD